MGSQDNELFLAASRPYEQQGGNPIFRAIFTQASRNRSFRGIVHQKKFRLTFLQLRTPEENKPLGEALTEAIRQGLQQVVQAENINPAQYSLLVAIYSNSFTNIWAQSARNVAASRPYEQQGGNPIFRAIFTQASRNRSFRGIVHQKKFRLTFLQLRTPEENKPLGEALTEAIRQGLQQVVQAENINPAQYSLLVAIYSNSFTNIWAQSARNVPLNEWLNNQKCARAYLEQLARKLNSAQMIDPERDGFFVELTFVKTFGQGSRPANKNPGKMASEKMAKTNRCVLQLKTTTIFA